jgi:hypothetical protein
MPHHVLPALPPHTLTARLPDGRSLIALLDPTTPAHHSPLQRALETALARDQGEAPRTDP